MHAPNEYTPSRPCTPPAYVTVIVIVIGRFLTVLRALFRPPQSTRVQKVVAPLLDASEEVLREKAAAVLGKVGVCCCCAWYLGIVVFSWNEALHSVLLSLGIVVSRDGPQSCHVSSLSRHNPVTVPFVAAGCCRCWC